VLLALAESARADDAGPYVRYRVAIDAPPTLAAALREGLDLYRWQGYETMTPELLRRLMVEAEAEAREIMAVNGYFSAVVKAALETGTDPQTVRIAVEPGEPARVTALDVRLTGPLAADPSAAEVLAARVREDWLLPVGAVFTQSDWERAKRRALEIVSERLYAAARVEASQALIDPDRRSAALSIAIDSGPPLRFGALQVRGTARHDEQRVRSLWTFARGEPSTASSGGWSRPPTSRASRSTPIRRAPWMARCRCA
jgi:translocation and assembly module TamA